MEHKYFEDRDTVFFFKEKNKTQYIKCFYFDSETKYKDSKIKFHQLNNKKVGERPMFILCVGSLYSSSKYLDYHQISDIDNCLYVSGLEPFFNFMLIIMTSFENGPKNLIRNNKILMGYYNFLDEFFTKGPQRHISNELIEFIEYRNKIFFAMKSNMENENVLIL